MFLRLESRRVLRLSSITLRGESDNSLKRATLDTVEMALRNEKQVGRVGIAEAEESWSLVNELKVLRLAQEGILSRKADQILSTWFEAPHESAVEHGEKCGGDQGEDESANGGVNSPVRRAKYKFGA